MFENRPIYKITMRHSANTFRAYRAVMFWRTAEYSINQALVTFLLFMVLSNDAAASLLFIKQLFFFSSLSLRICQQTT